MKQYLPLLIISLLTINILSGQVKIGDNPQTLHPASILELESNSRVLVITRVNDAQMSAINPLKGAVVYNTDHDCIHYYDGTNWINICEALDNTFTVSTRADYLRELHPENDKLLDSTIVITETISPEGIPNLNFEVNVINSTNIGASAVTNSKIQAGSIENRHIQPRTIAPIKFENGLNIGDLHRWNGFEWVLANESDILITEKDSIIGNEVTDATQNGSLIRSGGGTVGSPYTLDVMDGGIGNDELGPDAVTTDKIFDGTILEADLADNAITSIKIQDGTIITDDIADDAIITSKILDENVTESKLADNSVTLAKIGADPATESYKVLATDASGDPFWEDRTNFTSSNLTSSYIYVGDLNNLAQGVAMTGDATIVEDGTITISEGAVTTDKIFDGTIVTDDIADDAVITSKILDENVTEQKLATNAVTTAKIAVGNVTLDKLVDGTADNNIIRWNNTASQWEETNLSTGLGANVVSTDGSISGVEDFAALVAMDLEVNVDGTTLEVDETNGVQIVDGGVTTAKIADNAVTTDKIGTDGAAHANMVLTTDASGDPDWEDRDNFTSSALGQGNIFVGNTAGVAQGVEMSGDATMDETGEITIANGAVTIDKIGADPTTDADRVLTTDAGGTPQWEPKTSFDPSIKPIDIVGRGDHYLTQDDFTIIIVDQELPPPLEARIILPIPPNSIRGKMYVIRNDSTLPVSVHIGDSSTQLLTIDPDEASWVQTDGSAGWFQIN